MKGVENLFGDVKIQRKNLNLELCHHMPSKKTKVDSQICFIFFYMRKQESENDKGRMKKKERNRKKIGDEKKKEKGRKIKKKGKKETTEQRK